MVAGGAIAVLYGLANPSGVLVLYILSGITIAVLGFGVTASGELIFISWSSCEKTPHPAPASVMHQDGVILGENQHRGVRQQVALTDEQRTRHMYIVGVSGTGKTTLLLNLILQDIERGAGLCVLDPHGDLTERQILPRIPAHRVDDVIYVDPADATLY